MDLTSLLFPLLILLLFIPIFLSGRRQRKQVQEMQALQNALAPGDVVLTTSGLRGTVVDASYEETVDLEIADGVVTTWVRAAVKSKVDAEPSVPVVANEELDEHDTEDSTTLADVPDTVPDRPLSLEKDDSANGTARP